MKRIVAMTLTLSMLLCGCSSLLKKEYVTVAPHTEQYEAVEDTDVLTVENFAGLKSAILSFVEAGMEYGVIRAYNYDGDVTEDVASAAYEVARNDPLGAYAIDYLTHDCSRIVSYYELHFYITYRRNGEDIQNIKRVYNTNEAEEEIKNLITDVAESAALRYSYYNDTDFTQLLSRIRNSEPELDLGDPQVTASLYPDSGVQRVVELQFSYSLPREQLLEKRQETEKKVGEIADSISDSASEELRSYRMFKRLAASAAVFDENMDEQESEAAAQFADSAYGALIEGEATSRGFAMAYLALCDAMGVDCQLVYGRRNGYDFYWNIIKLGEHYYHVDVCSAVEYGYGGYLLKDEDMVNYRWDRDDYPVCDGDLTYYDVVPSMNIAEKEQSD